MMGNASYTGVVLFEQSRVALISAFQNQIEDGWEVIAHHMTCNMGAANTGPAADFLGKEVQLVVSSFAKDRLVAAVGIQCIVPSTNLQKHITLAVNRKEGGKPFFSNKLQNWESSNLPHVPILLGRVQEVDSFGNPLK